MSELVIIIRPSFKKFCDQDACRAALFNHLLYWISRKGKGQSVENIKQGKVSWFGTAEDICEGLDHSWSINKIRKEVKELVDANLIGQRRNPANSWDQTRHYFIGEEQGKVIKTMCDKHGIFLLHLGLQADVIHLLNLVNAITKCGESNCQICQMDLPNTANRNTKSGNAIPKVTTKGSDKGFNKEKRTFSNSNSNQSNNASTLTSQEKQNAAMKKLLEAAGMTEDIDQVQ
jgi:hypothetical protein